jgi:hypothetical protein
VVVMVVSKVDGGEVERKCDMSHMINKDVHMCT